MYQKKMQEDIRCPLEYGLEVFGGKWKSRIICVLAEKKLLRYSEIAISRQGEGNTNEAPSFLTGFLLQLVNVKIYFYISTLLTAYLIPYIKSLPALILAGVGVTIIGSAASLTWAFLGVKLQNIYSRHFRIINIILALFLLYCAWEIIK